MQEPANMPLEVMCHCLERKQASLTVQFHNIEILQLFEPPCIPPMLIEWEAVLELMAPVDVAVAMDMSIIMSPWATMMVYIICGGSEKEKIWGLKKSVNSRVVLDTQSRQC